MHTLLRLPLALLELALRDGLSLARSVLRLVQPSSGEDPAPAPSRPVARPDPAAPRPVRADAAMQRTRERERAAVPPPAPPVAPPVPEAELLGEQPARVSREAEPVASFGPSGDAHATIDVMPPWKGYEAQPAAAIVARVRGSDEATKAVVLLFEQGHKRRATVLKAARA